MRALPGMELRCYAKQKNVPEEFIGTPGYGDVWTWVAIDADTKLVPSWLVGERTTQDCWVFLSDLKSPSGEATRTLGWMSPSQALDEVLR